MDHYAVSMEKIQPRRANENGDVESSHRHLKKAIEQAWLLRGSVDFESTDAYMRLVNQQVALRNAGRSERFAEEQQVMKSLRRSASKKLPETDVGENWKFAQTYPCKSVFWSSFHG